MSTHTHTHTHLVCVTLCRWYAAEKWMYKKGGGTYRSKHFSRMFQLERCKQVTFGWIIQLLNASYGADNTFSLMS